MAYLGTSPVGNQTFRARWLDYHWQMADWENDTADHIRKMIRKSRELAQQSHVLRLRSEEVIAETETLLQKCREDNSTEPRRKPRLGEGRSTPF